MERKRKKEKEKIVSIVICFFLLPMYIIMRQIDIFGSHLVRPGIRPWPWKKTGIESEDKWHS